MHECVHHSRFGASLATTIPQPAPLVAQETAPGCAGHREGTSVPLSAPNSLPDGRDGNHTVGGWKNTEIDSPAPNTYKHARSKPSNIHRQKHARSKPSNIHSAETVTAKPKTENQMRKTINKKSNNKKSPKQNKTKQKTLVYDPPTPIPNTKESPHISI